MAYSQQQRPSPHLQFNYGFDSAPLLILLIVFFFLISPLSPQIDGEEWQDTDNSSASLIRVLRFLITFDTDAKCVNGCIHASAKSKADIRQQHVWVT